MTNALAMQLSLLLFIPIELPCNVDVNGQFTCAIHCKKRKLIMLIDTGSAITIIDKMRTDRLIEWTLSDAEISSDYLPAKTATSQITFIVNSLSYKCKTYGSILNTPNAAYARQGLPEIDGIIGTDMIKKK